MNRSVLVLLSIFVAVLGGCAEVVVPGGGGGGRPTPFFLTVTPATASVVGLGTQQFAANSSDGSKPALTWSVNEVVGGDAARTGTHQLVLGSAVKGNAVYGAFPTLALGGPDDADRNGRWIPTTALDQYAATLATWFGVSAANLPTIFPNLANFATSNLGFMG